MFFQNFSLSLIYYFHFNSWCYGAFISVLLVNLTMVANIIRQLLVVVWN